MPSCQSYGCSSKSSGKTRTQNVSYFHFPDPKKDQARAERWLNNIGTGYTVESFYFKGKVVCSDHFRVNCFEVDMMANFMRYTSKRRNLKSVMYQPCLNIKLMI